MLFSIPATVTLGSGATYRFPNLHPPSRVTKLLAQFATVQLTHRRLTPTPSLIFSRAPIMERFQGVAALAACPSDLIVTDL
jgi:hypothetical protein